MAKLPKLNQTDLVAIFGKRGSGKTTLGRSFQKQFPRLLIVDLVREYSNHEVDLIVRSAKDLARALIAFITHKRRNFKICYQFDLENSQDDESEDFDKICELAYKAGDLMIAVEEIHHYCHGEHLPSWLKKLILIGRHRKVGIIATSQKPATVSKVFVSQCSHVFVARMFERNDIKYFAESLGESAAERIAKLEKFCFFHFESGSDSNEIVRSK